MTTSENLVLDVDGLRMRYGTTDVLHEVNFQARHGEVLALLGPNGAGKTTTIEILEGFRMRSAGHIQVLGTDPAHGDERWRARGGVVLQPWRDPPKWGGGVGRGGQAAKQVRVVAGGQRRRLDVAIGIVGRPEVLFLDEPTAGFDPQARRDLHHLVPRLSHNDDTTILLTTHDLDEAEKLADRILILAGGRIIADGSADQLSRLVSAEAEVRWSHDGGRFVH